MNSERSDSVALHNLRWQRVLSRSRVVSERVFPRIGVAASGWVSLSWVSHCSMIEMMMMVILMMVVVMVSVIMVAFFIVNGDDDDGGVSECHDCQVYDYLLIFVPDLIFKGI